MPLASSLPLLPVVLSFVHAQILIFFLMNFTDCYLNWVCQQPGLGFSSYPVTFVMEVFVFMYLGSCYAPLLPSQHVDPGGTHTWASRSPGQITEPGM